MIQVNEWLKSVRSGDEADEFTNKDIADVINRNEESARRYFLECRETFLPRSIDQAIEKGKSYVMLSAPISVIDSSAYDEFKGWARESSLDIRIFGIEKERLSAGKDDFVILSVTPKV